VALKGVGEMFVQSAMGLVARLDLFLSQILCKELADEGMSV
jgi:hypothetical protein